MRISWERNAGSQQMREWGISVVSGITDAITGSGSNYANPTNRDTVDVSTPFEAADRSSLQFKPDLTVTTSAKTSRADGASLTAKLTVPSTLGTRRRKK